MMNTVVFGLLILSLGNVMAEEDFEIENKVPNPGVIYDCEAKLGNQTIIMYYDIPCDDQEELEIYKLEQEILEEEEQEKADEEEHKQWAELNYQ